LRPIAVDPRRAEHSSIREKFLDRCQIFVYYLFLSTSSACRAAARAGESLPQPRSLSTKRSADRSALSARGAAPLPLPPMIFGQGAEIVDSGRLPMEPFARFGRLLRGFWRVLARSEASFRAVSPTSRQNPDRERRPGICGGARHKGHRAITLARRGRSKARCPPLPVPRG